MRYYWGGEGLLDFALHAMTSVHSLAKETSMAYMSIFILLLMTPFTGWNATAISTM